MNAIVIALIVLVLVTAFLPDVDAIRKSDGSTDDTIQYSSKTELQDKVKEIGKKKFGNERSELDLQNMAKEEKGLKKKVAEAEAKYGKMSRQRAAALHALGRNVYQRGLYREVFDVSKEIVTIHEELDGPEHVDTAQALSNVGSVAFQLGEQEYCALVMNRALYILLKEYGDNSKEVLVHRGRMLTFHVTDAEKSVGLSHEDFLYEL